MWTKNTFKKHMDFKQLFLILSPTLWTRSFCVAVSIVMELTLEYKALLYAFNLHLTLRCVMQLKSLELWTFYASCAVIAHSVHSTFDMAISAFSFKDQRDTEHRKKRTACVCVCSLIYTMSVLIFYGCFHSLCALSCSFRTVHFLY